ncbi:MAG: DedA family protein [Thermoplasmataceae archaeon]
MSVLLSIVDSVVLFVQNLISTIGYPGIFGLMVLEGLLIPVPSEVVLAFGGYLALTGALPPYFGISAYIIVLIAGSLGNLVGALLAYVLGDKGGIPLIMRYGKYFGLDEGSIQRTHRWFVKYGDSSVFFTRLVPVFRSFISIPAGVAKMRLRDFTILTLVGSILWDILLVYLGYSLGPHWQDILSYFDQYTYVAAAAFVAVLIWIIYRGHLRKKGKMEGAVAKH